MKTLYILVRIPKSGSQSLRTMVRKSLPDSAYFRIPQLGFDRQATLSFPEKFRHARRLAKGMLMSYGALSEEKLWKKINQQANDGDIISGHLAYGRPKLPDAQPRYITLLRDPVPRIISQYNYTREGYPKHKHLRKLYQEELTKIAGTQSFSEYLEYLYAHKEQYQNPTTGYVTGSSTHSQPFEFLKENYFHFGILERMDLFSSQLAEKLNTPLCDAWVNKTGKKEAIQLSERDHELLNELMGRDIALYAKTKQHLEN